MRHARSFAILAGILTSCGGAEQPSAQDEFEQARQDMVATQLKARDRGIKDTRVLTAMATVPRHEFVPEPQRKNAYRDGPLPIGHGQTISQPYIVAFMTEKLDPQASDRILEIGTGSGYQAAILAKLVKEVYSIEIVKPLAERAKAVLANLEIGNVHVRAGDGYKGWPKHAPFDAVIVTCAPEHIPEALVKQLKEGGRMIIPVGPQQSGQKLILLRKKNGKIHREAVLPVRFVPMTREKPGGGSSHD